MRRTLCNAFIVFALSYPAIAQQPTTAVPVGVVRAERKLEGQGPVEGVTVYEFPSRDAARSWYDSVAYQEARQHRKKGAKYLVILTEGGVPPAEQRMPHTRVAGSAAAPPGVNDISA